VSADGTRLYLGTYPDTLEIVDLDRSGHPIAGTLRSFPAGSEPGSHGQDYLAFHYTPQALYRLPFQWITTPRWPLVVWPLDVRGDPAGTPQQFPDLIGQGFAIDATSHRAWFAIDDTFTDAFTGATVADGIMPATVALDPTSGLPWGASQAVF